MENEVGKWGRGKQKDKRRKGETMNWRKYGKKMNKEEEKSREEEEEVTRGKEETRKKRLRVILWQRKLHMNTDLKWK